MDEDSNSFRIMNFYSFKIILQSRFGPQENDTCKSFTMNSKTMVNVEISDETGNFCICGSKHIDDTMVLQ